MKTALLAALASAVLVAGCGGGSDDKQTTSSGSGSGSGSATTSIEIADFQYKPDPALVHVGEKIAISNTDDAPHTVTDKGSGKTFDSGTVKGGSTGSVTFKKAGTFSYTCEFHPTMSGRVTVEP